MNFTNVKKLKTYFTRSYSRFGLGLFLTTVIISLPFTVGILNQQEERTMHPTQITQSSVQIASSNSDNCTPAGDSAGLDPEEQSFLGLLNSYRQSMGLSPVSTSSKLSSIAQWHAIDMANKNYFDHNDSIGRTPAARTAACGINNYNTIDGGEIINAGTNHNAQSSIAAFKASSGHNSVMVNPRNIQVGIGHAYNANSTNGHYWVVDFGNTNDGTTAQLIAGEPTSTPTAAPTAGPCICTSNVRNFSCDETTTAYCTPGTQAYKCTTGGQWIPITDACTGSSITPTVTSTIIPTVTTTITPVITEDPLPTAMITQPVASISSGLEFSIQLPGIGKTGNKTPNMLALGLDVKLLNPTNDQTIDITKTKLEFDPATSLFSGKVKVIPGTYQIFIKTDNSLWKNLGIGQVIDGQITNLYQATLVTGDLNQDNILDLQDYTIFVACFGNKSCIQKTVADVNSDMKVNQLDLNIFYSGLANRKGD